MGLAEADVKNTRVALPAGVQLSPSAADGLLACSPEQIDLHSPEPPTCPDASKVGTVEIRYAVVADPLMGSVYLASQNDNPFGSLIALYIVAENKEYGVLVKVAGQTIPDPVTGQLVTTFNETPPLPFSDLKLSFFGTAPRAFDDARIVRNLYDGNEYRTVVWYGCGAPVLEVPDHQRSSGITVLEPSCLSVPGFESGSTNLQAGAFSPFTLTMSRPDGDQTLSRIEMQMPPGLLGTLSHVKLCGEPQASQGTCGEESLIGHTIVSAGFGQRSLHRHRREDLHHYRL